MNQTLQESPWKWKDMRQTDLNIKNIRMAKGGVKYYDRVLSEGEIIVNGIRFDVNKATLEPESMGPINKIFQLMNKDSEVDFSIEGHTDSDGGDANNQKLSEARAKTAMNKLIEMGIAKNRLESTGFGESKPIDNNKLTIKYVTYDNGGAVLSRSDHLEVNGAYTCDLDKGKTEGVISFEEDFHLNIQDSKTITIDKCENSILKIVE
ncbi:MAG: hypothetical protein CR994_00450 [Maribacter sp.]|nr:MAG: hypothetical protein CR994_00450 [Maribacter sp.]